MSNDIQDQLKRYDELKNYNGLALESLSNIGTRFMDQKSFSEMEKEFCNSINYITEMAKSCVALGADIKLENILDKIDYIAQSTISVISSSMLTLELGYKDTSLEDIVKNRLYSQVQKLSRDMRSPEDSAFSLSNASTLHDMIRFLHQIGVNKVYDFDNLKQLEKSSSQYFKSTELRSGGHMKLIDVDDILPSGKNIISNKIEHPILFPIVKLYNDSIDKRGNEIFLGIVTANKLMTQIKMGSHYAEMEIYTGNNNCIDLLFRNTAERDYENAPYRTKYVTNVLKKLGYSVSTKKLETKAGKEHIPHAQMPQAITDITRLLLSTKDLDIKDSHLEAYPHKSVNAFFDNVTNIYTYLSKADHKGEKDDPRIY